MYIRSSKSKASQETENVNSVYVHGTVIIISIKCLLVWKDNCQKCGWNNGNRWVWLEAKYCSKTVDSQISSMYGWHKS